MKWFTHERWTNMEEFEILHDIKQFIKGVTRMWQNYNHGSYFKAFVPLGGKMKNKGDFKNTVTTYWRNKTERDKERSFKVNIILGKDW